MTPPVNSLTDAFQIENAAGSKPPELQKMPEKVKVAIRPIAITRQSNDYFTNLTHNSARLHDGSIGSPMDVSPQISQQGQVPLGNKRLMTSSYPPKNKWRIIVSCLWAITSGFSDAAPGALLPTIEAHYRISYSIVSLIWMSNAVGFVLVALLSHKIQPWLGREKSIPFGCICSIIMYAIVSSGGPFPLIVVGFFCGGIGLAVVVAQVNIFLSKMEKNSKYLSFFHGCYGLGATISPFLATTMIERNVPWNYTYLIMLGLMLINFVTIGYAFKGADEDLKEWDHDEETDNLITSHDTKSGRQTPSQEAAVGFNEFGAQDLGLQDLGAHVTSVDNKPTNSSNAQTDLKLALRNIITWEISLFTLFYQGCEVALGGWIVTYLIDYRLTNNSYGYVSSGYWGGLTIGRLFLTRPLHKLLGARRTINLLLINIVLMLALTWVVKSDILSSVFMSIAGTLIGPIYPLMITAVAKMLPRRIQVISLTIMTAFGSSGGALIPFFVGLISQSSGTFVVLPICIAGYSLVLVIWLLLPNMDRNRDLSVGPIKRFLHALW